MNKKKEENKELMSKASNTSKRIKQARLGEQRWLTKQAQNMANIGRKQRTYKQSKQHKLINQANKARNTASTASTKSAAIKQLSTADRQSLLFVQNFHSDLLAEACIARFFSDYPINGSWKNRKFVCITCYNRIIASWPPILCKHLKCAISGVWNTFCLYFEESLVI